MIEPRVSCITIAPMLMAWMVGAACAEGSADSALVRDSADVRVVENPAPPDPPTTVWRIDATPSIEIGAREGTDETQMLTRVGFASMLGDGRIIVLDAIAPHLRIFDANGAPLGSAIQAGEGPGEVSAPSSFLVLPGDSMLIYDSGLLRMSVFSPSAEFVRSFSIHPQEGPGRTFLIGRFTDGTFATYRAWSSAQLPPDQPSGVYRHTNRFTRFGSDGEPAGILGDFLDSERALIATEQSRTHTSPPFSKGRLQTLSGDNLIIAYTERFELSFYGPQGRLRQITRLAIEPDPITSEDRSTYVEQRMSGVGDNPDAAVRVRRILDAIPFPTEFPVIARMRADKLGNVWVMRYPRGLDAESARWEVFSPDGFWLTTTRFPDGFSVLEIGDDYVLGSYLDEFNVPYVRLHRLIKN